VVLCISEPTSIKDITLVLQGIVRVAVPDESPTPSILHSELEKHEEIFYEKKWTFFDGGGRLYQTNASNFEYSFHERLCGSKFLYDVALILGDKNEELRILSFYF
jgi:hypothetical protein